MDLQSVNVSAIHSSPLEDTESVKMILMFSDAMAVNVALRTLSNVHATALFNDVFETKYKNSPIFEMGDPWRSDFNSPAKHMLPLNISAYNKSCAFIYCKEN